MYPAQLLYADFSISWTSPPFTNSFRHAFLTEGSEFYLFPNHWYQLRLLSNEFLVRFDTVLQCAFRSTQGISTHGTNIFLYHLLTWINGLQFFPKYFLDFTAALGDSRWFPSLGRVCFILLIGYFPLIVQKSFFTLSSQLEMMYTCFPTFFVSLYCCASVITDCSLPVYSIHSALFRGCPRSVPRFLYIRFFTQRSVFNSFPNRLGSVTAAMQ